MKQRDKLNDAFEILADIWLEMISGEVDDNTLQDAVYVQTMINRIVWMLNERKNHDGRRKAAK